MVWNVPLSATSPLTDWRSIFQLGNLLSFAGIAATVYYALRAEKKATTALEAAANARRDLLARVAAEELREVLQRIRTLVVAMQSDRFADAEEVARALHTTLASAKTSWPNLLIEIQHEEVEVALRENQRLLETLRNAALPARDRTTLAIRQADFMSQLLGQVYGRLRFWS